MFFSTVGDCRKVWAFAEADAVGGCVGLPGGGADGTNGQRDVGNVHRSSARERAGGAHGPPGALYQALHAPPQACVRCVRACFDESSRVCVRVCSSRRFWWAGLLVRLSWSRLRFCRLCFVPRQRVRQKRRQRLAGPRGQERWARRGQERWARRGQGRWAARRGRRQHHLWRKRQERNESALPSFSKTALAENQTMLLETTRERVRRLVLHRHQPRRSLRPLVLLYRRVTHDRRPAPVHLRPLRTLRDQQLHHVHDLVLL